MRNTLAITLAALSAAVATPALAASDYLLELDGVKGESAAPAVDSWSFGVCNPGQCSSAQRTVITARDAGSGMATGKTGKTGKPSSANWDLATSKGARTAAAGGVKVAAGDVDGDGRADLAFAGTVSEVYDLSFAFQKIEATLRSVCGGKHIAKATLRSASDSFEITDAAVSCTAGGGAAAASYAATGRQAIDSTPARISTNMTTAKQTQGATFGERSAAPSGDALTDGLIIMRLTGGQMKHTKTGHVTLLK